MNHQHEEVRKEFEKQWIVDCECELCRLGNKAARWQMEWWLSKIAEAEEQAYKKGQKYMIYRWKKWKFGNWFFPKRKKQIDAFLKEFLEANPGFLDTTDIQIIPNPAKSHE